MSPALNSWCQALIDKYFDETIDGDRTNQQDAESFLEPFLYTLILQSAQ